MFHRILIAILIAIALIGILPSVLNGQCACYTEDPQGPYFDAATVEAVGGTIKDILYVEAKRRGMGQGVHLELETVDGVLNVHLGPAWFLDNQEQKLEAGATVEVLGSVVTTNGERQLIAAEVRTEDGLLALRNDTGYPNWRAWRRGPGPYRCGRPGGPPQNR